MAVVVCLVTLGLLAASALIGAALWRLAGLAPAPQLAPVVGFGALLVVALPAVRLPGWAATGLVVIVVLALAAATDRRARRALASGLADSVPVTLIALLLLCLPFIVSGHFGILGMGNNDDWAMHMNGVRWLAHHEVPQSDTLVAWGYPLGTHGLAAALTATGITVPMAMTVIMAAGPIVSALAALAMLRAVARPARWALALLVGLAYLAASYYAQAAHKEVMAAPLVLGFALVLPAVAGTVMAPRAGGARAAARAVLPPAVLLAGAVQVLSWPGALWPLVTLAGWAGLALLAPRRRELWALRRRIAAAVGAGAVAVAVMLGPDVGDIIGFQNSSFAHEPANGHGNLASAIPPYEDLGVWLQPDFRFASHLPVLNVVLMVGAGVLVALAVVHWLRRGPRVLAAAFAADWVVWVLLTVAKNPYNAAKGLAVIAPLMGLTLVTGALLAWAPRRRDPERAEEEPLPRPLAAATYAVLGGVPGALRGLTLRRAAVLAVLVAAGASSFLALRDGIVGVDAHAAELRSLSTTAQRGQTVFLDPSDYGVWDLYPLRPFRPRLLYMVHAVPLRPEKHWHAGEALDLDSMTAATINRFRWFITSNTTYASAPPPGLRLARESRSWQLWERVGTVAPRSILPGEQGAPGAVLDCSTPFGRALSHRRGTAIVRGRPVVGAASAWHGDARAAGSTATQTLRLPPGRWDLSLQYVSRNPIDVSGPGLRTTMPANLDRMSNFFSVGTVRGGGTATITVHVHELPAIGRALGARGVTVALNSPHNQPLGMLAATPHGDRPHTVPLARACGRYVDAYTPG